MPEVDDENTPSAKQVKEYIDAANECLRSGWDSCDKSKALEAAAVAYGLDPDVAGVAGICLDDPESDACAKASAKLAAVAACTAATEGAGVELCTKFAPVVVDIVWPYVGPIVGPVWKWSVGLLGSAAGVIEGLGKAVGFDFGTDADPTVTDVYWDIQGALFDQLKNAYDQSISAMEAARDSSASELELSEAWEVKPIDTISQAGKLYLPGQSPKEAAMRAAMVDELERWLALEPGWSDEIVVEQTRTIFGKVQRRFVKFGAKPAGVQSFSTKCGPDANGNWVCSGWNASSFSYFTDGWSWGNDRKALADCAASGMSQRAQGLRQATMNAIGSVIQKQTMRADAARLDELSKRSSGSSGLLLLLFSAAAVAGGIWLWKKRH